MDKKEKPILFNEPMVRAICAGNKTMTRRVVKTPADTKRFCVGDMLWVRETFAKTSHGEYIYRADPVMESKWMGKWTPSIHMPREAARIFLEVTGVRVELLREITLGDSIREGFIEPYRWAEQESLDTKIIEMGNKWPLWQVFTQWNDIYGKGYRWKNNPHVMVVEFRKAEHE
ncbi:MAG: hypothetical protein LBP19_00025 [Treponema sp.]|jgi:hypothetical protein|nr:hypothetical protein [Treponema sp.]